MRRFIDTTIAEVRRTGVAVNLFGRRRPIPDMNSRNPNARNFAERTAVNTPLQGTAADLIKLAMIRIDEKLRGMQTQMLLQVHDELVFEAPPEEVDDGARHGEIGDGERRAAGRAAGGGRRRGRQLARCEIESWSGLLTRDGIDDRHWRRRSAL